MNRFSVNEKLDYIIIITLIVIYVFSALGKIFIPLFPYFQYVIIGFVFLYTFKVYARKTIFKIHSFLSLFLCLTVFVCLKNYKDVSIVLATYFLPLIGALFLSENKYESKIVNVLKFFLLLNFFAVVCETITGTHFVPVTEDIDALGTIIYKCGLFNNPKEGGAVISFSALIFFLYREYVFVVIAFLLTIFVGVRTATVIAFVPFVLSCKEIFKNGYGKLCLFILVFLIWKLYGIIGEMFEFSERFWERLLDTFSFSDQGNELRISFMAKHLEIWVMQYDIFDYLFGRMNYTRTIINNGAESTWIDLLTNVGLFSFLMYLHPYIVILKKNVYTKKIYIIISAVLFCCLGISGVGTGLSSILYWYVVIKLYKL